MSRFADLPDSVPPSVSAIPPTLESKITSGDSLPMTVEPNDENLERYKRVQDIETGVTAKFRGQTYQVCRPVA
jgi:hypothetical protein